MSLTLLLISRRSISLANFSQLRTAFLRPHHLSPAIFLAESSTFKTKYGSVKPPFISSTTNPFRLPTDEKSRRLKVQEQIRFRDKFQLENDYELMYSMPRQRMYSIMHLVCTCACITMIVFVIIHFHRDMLDTDILLTGINQQIPPWVLYSVATVVASTFGLVLFLISRMPVRMYYSPSRRSYALFYHPIIGVLRQKKIVFHDNQYRFIPQKLDSIESAQRSVRIRIELGQGLLATKKSFYLIETLFRSRRDIHRIRTKDIETINVDKNKDQDHTQEESDIWETVIERKDQINNNSPPPRRTFTR